MVIEQYENQLASTTDVLDAEATLTKARENYNISYYQLLKAYLKLKIFTTDLSDFYIDNQQLNFIKYK